MARDSRLLSLLKSFLHSFSFILHSKDDFSSSSRTGTYSLQKAIMCVIILLQSVLFIINSGGVLSAVRVRAAVRMGPCS